MSEKWRNFKVKEYPSENTWIEMTVRTKEKEISFFGKTGKSQFVPEDGTINTHITVDNDSFCDITGNLPISSFFHGQEKDLFNSLSWYYLNQIKSMYIKWRYVPTKNHQSLELIRL